MSLPCASAGTRLSSRKPQRAIVVERIGSMSAADRESTDEAGFMRAGIVESEAVGLLVDDVARLMTDGRFLVLGYAELPPPSPRLPREIGRGT